MQRNRRTLYVPRGRGTYRYSFDFDVLGLSEGDPIDVVTSRRLSEPYMISGSRIYEFRICGFAPLRWSPVLVVDPHDANPFD